MATSSILGGSPPPADISGKDVHSLGPSDNSDSGSDAIGAYGNDELASDSDAAGTGERATLGPGDGQPDADILPDHTEPAVPADDDGIEDIEDDDMEGDDIDADLDADFDPDDLAGDFDADVDVDPDFPDEDRRA